MSKSTSEWKEQPFEVYDFTLDVVTTSEATIAVLSGFIDGEEFTWNGVSRRFPGDRYVPSIGVKLATGRAFYRAARQLLKQGNGLVKNQDDNRARAHELQSSESSVEHHRVVRRRQRSDRRQPSSN